MVMSHCHVSFFLGGGGLYYSYLSYISICGKIGDKFPSMQTTSIH